MPPWLALVAALTILVPTAETFCTTAVPPPAVNADKAISWLSTTASASNHAAAGRGSERPIFRMMAASLRLSDDLRGQVAVVTGSSRGIGKGIAVTLGERGCTVYVTGRSAGGASTDQVSLVLVYLVEQSEFVLSMFADLEGCTQATFGKYV